MKYIKRIIDKDLDLRVKAFGAISIVGPKGCGKTRTAKERCKTIIEFEFNDVGNVEMFEDTVDVDAVKVIDNILNPN